MADIVNLRRHRKAKLREAADAKAAQNRVTFGLSKRERAGAESERRAQERKLSGLKRDRDPPEGGEA